MEKIGQCKRCGETKKLCNSHIISDLFYNYIRDKETGKIELRSNITSRKFTYAGRREKLVTEPILCEDCEGWRSKYETYAKQVLDGSVGITSTLRDNEAFFKGIDYSKFKLFQLSTLWMASVSSRVSYSDVNLGKHEPIIKEMLLNDSPGRYYEYGCVMIPVLGIDNEKPTDSSLNPDFIKRGGHTIYRFVMGGFIWLYFVSSHTKQLSQKEYFLQENGDLRIPLEAKHFHDVPFIRGAMKKIGLL